jgi:chromosome partitioning protein
MAHIISIIQVKGGAGRSTIATNLAGLISKSKKVALIDCDMPQATSASWAAIRQGNITTATATDHNQVVTEIQRLNDSHDFIVIDAPPRIAEITKVALMLSELCLVPLGASAAEIWATSDLIKTIDAAKELKADIDVRIIWNRFRASTRSAQELSEAAHNELNLKELKNKLGYRVAYSEALARGMTVTEWTDKTAKSEILSLAKEIEKILKVKFIKD